MEIPVFFIIPNDIFAPAVVSMVSVLENKYPQKEAKIIHYNDSKKLWKCDMFLDNLFWRYAKKTPFIKELRSIKKKALQDNTITYYLFNSIPLLKVKTDDMRKFYYLFGCIPVIKITKR